MADNNLNEIMAALSDRANKRFFAANLGLLAAVFALIGYVIVKK